MSANGWLQILIYSLVILAVTKPLGIYMFRVFEGDQQPLPRFFGPIERRLYRLCGVDPREQQTWTEYTLNRTTRHWYTTALVECPTPPDHELVGLQHSAG